MYDFKQVSKYNIKSELFIFMDNFNKIFQFAFKDFCTLISANYLRVSV